MEEVSIEEIVQEAQEKEIKYYANVDGNGKLIGWYNTDIHNEDAIPAPKIEVTKEAWQNAIDNGHNKVNEDGTTKLFDFRTEEEKAEQEKVKKVSDARKYLADTAWYIERLNDPSSGKAVPQEVLDKRDGARAIINELEG